MGRLGGCLAFFLLVLCPPLLFPYSFSECVQQPKLYRFWQDAGYLSSNPYISRAYFLEFYSFAFDISSQGSGIESAPIADGNYFRSSLPPALAEELSAAAASLDSASASLLEAAQAQKAAHSSSLAAQNAAKSIFSPETAVILQMQMYGINPLANMQMISKIIESADLLSYMAGYPQQLWAYYSAAADAFDSANAASLAIARKADEKLQWLAHAGAGQPAYFGSAQQKYLEAKALLAPSSPICSPYPEGRAVSDYFSSKPPLPNLSSVGFADYLGNAAGRKNTSKVFLLAALYSKLSQAEKEMESDYAGSLVTAGVAVQSLETEVKLLAAERLDLIGEPPVSSSPASVAVGSSFSGIYSGFQSAKGRLEESQQLLSGAKQYHSASEAENFLANAILLAKAANQTASSALSSLHSVRANAESAVSYQRELANAAVSKAESAVSATPSSFTDAQALEEARRLLEEAKGKRASADHMPSLGEKFAAYSEAARLAAEASAASERAAFLPSASAAQQELLRLGSLLSAAKNDGLDVSYEEWRLSQYTTLLSSSRSLDSAEAVRAAAKADEQGVLLRLAEAYSGLAEKHSQVRALVMEIRKEQPLFLPEFDSLSQYFDGSTLLVQLAAGRLKQIESKLNSQHALAQERLPAHLSWALSQNAEVSELYGEPVLGRQGPYSAAISTSNPSPFAYSGSLGFSVRTKVPLYSADFKGGDRLADAYPENGSTTIGGPGTEGFQQFRFAFEKLDSPAQPSSSIEKCSAAFQDSAMLTRNISFFSTRSLPSLALAEEAPSGAYGAKAMFLGREYGLENSISEKGGPELRGEIASVKQGQNSLLLTYFVSRPFSVSSSERSYAELGFGAKRASYKVLVSGVQIDCASASVELEEPFSNISALSVSSLGAEEVALPKAIPFHGASRIVFSFQPLRKGQNASFIVSYTINDAAEALSQALASAELQVAQYNRQSDASLLAQAKLLAQQNRSGEALAILSKMREDALQLALSSADRERLLEEEAAASRLLSEALAAQERLGQMGADEQLGALAALAFKLNSSLQECRQLAESGSYGKALSACRKAQSDFKAELSSLAWESASKASQGYAAARREGAGADSLAEAAGSIFRANSLYASGEHLQSFLLSSAAMRALSNLSESQLLGSEAAAAELKGIASDFAALGSATDSLLAEYSSQYSVLSAQGKKQLPITPAAAQQKIDDAAKGMAAAAKMKNPLQGLEQANSSYQKLMAVGKSLEAALSHLNSSAVSSLAAANAALLEAKAKASPEDQAEISHISSEIQLAQEYLSGSRFADSLMASDRALSAATMLISKKSAGGISATAALLAAASIAFLAVAAFYFLKKSGQKKEERKKVERAD